MDSGQCSTCSLSTLDIVENHGNQALSVRVCNAPQPGDADGQCDSIQNAMLAKNTDLANKPAIDLSDDLVSAKLLIPLEPDFPLLGGKTLRLNTGVEMAYREGRPVAILKGVGIMGTPIPNAWLGNLKNVDLVNGFGGDQGCWKSFSEGVDNIRVE